MSEEEFQQLLDNSNLSKNDQIINKFKYIERAKT